MSPLTPAERSRLKARAHALRPVVAVGNEGLSAAVLKELDSSLKAHELIKVRVAEEDRALRKALLDEICARCGAAPVQQIGKILVVFRESPEGAEAPPRALPRPKRKAPRRLKRSYQND